MPEQTQWKDRQQSVLPEFLATVGQHEGMQTNFCNIQGARTAEHMSVQVTDSGLFERYPTARNGDLAIGMCPCPIEAVARHGQRQSSGGPSEGSTRNPRIGQCHDSVSQESATAQS